MTALTAPDLADVLAARERIAPYLQPTPLYRYPALDELTGVRLWVKHENHQPVGNFKVRGGVVFASHQPAGSEGNSRCGHKSVADTFANLLHGGCGIFNSEGRAWVRQINRLRHGR